MKILCYMDPVYEVIQPESYNMRNFTLRFELLPQMLMSNKNQDVEVYVLALDKVVKSFDVEKIFINKGIKIVTFSEDEINEIFIDRDIKIEYIKEVCGSQIFDGFEKAIKEKIKDVEFDVIYGWEFIPHFLEKIYPNALLLECEHSLFTRYVSRSDVVFIPKNKDIEEAIYNEISNKSLNQQEQIELENIRTQLRDQISSFGIIDKNIIDPLNKYKKFIFFPGHYECACFSRYSKYKNEYNILKKLIKSTAEDICILYTKHPLTKSSNIDNLIKASDRIVDLNKLYPNNKDISYLALLIADAVVNSHSKMGITAMLLGVPTIDIDNFISCKYTYNIKIDACKLTSSNLPSSVHELSDKFIYYFLSNSHIQSFFTYPGAFLWFLKQSYINYKNNARSVKILPATCPISEFAFFAVVSKNNKSVIKNTISRTYTKYEEIKYNIITHDNVCFDVFDTLVQRPLSKPTDLFYLMSSQVSDIIKRRCFNFSQARSTAEWHARKRAVSLGMEDTNITEIYKSLGYLYNINEELCNKIKELEIYYENLLCFKRESGYCLYNFAKLLNKNIYIISDMYLEKENIIQILKNCGYEDYKRLLLSSDIGRMKRNGGLYEYLLQTELLVPEATIMIGDNIESDINQPVKLGISSYQLNSSIESFKNRSLTPVFLQTTLKHNTCAPYGIVATKFFDNPFTEYSDKTLFNNSPCNLGYYLLGPICMSFVMWIVKNISSLNKYKLVLFSARDCYLLNQIYNMVRENNKGLKNKLPPSVYFYMSRSSTMSYLLKEENISSVLDIYTTSYNALDILKEFFKFDISKSPLRKFKLKLSLLDMSNKYDLCWFKDFVKCNYSEITKNININNDIENLKLYVENVLNHYNIDSLSDVCIVDSGARGTSSDILSDIFDCDIDLYLFRQYRYKYGDDFNKFAYFKETFNIFRTGVSAFASRLYEPLISCAVEGTCVGYRQTDEGIMPVLDDIDVTSINNNIFITQKSVLDFCKDYIKFFKEFPFAILHDSQRSYESILEFCFAGNTDRELFNSYLHTDSIWGKTRLDLVLPPLLKKQITPIPQNACMKAIKQNKVNLNENVVHYSNKAVYSENLKHLDRIFSQISNMNILGKIFVKPFWVIGRNIVIWYKSR